VTSPQSLDSAVRQLNLATSGVDRLEFVAPDEADLVGEVRSLFTEFRGVMTRVLDLAGSGSTPAARDLYAAQATPLADRIARRLDELVHKAQAETLDHVDRTHAAFATSQRLIGGFALGSIALATLVGLALSLSIVRPVRRMESHLGRIASGDFSEHVAVENRDELGTLGAGFDRMNDELARLYGEIQTANQRKSEFLANMSHELRTPLNAIIGFSDVLLQRMFGDINEKQEEYLRDILGSGQHQLALVNDILDLSKVEAGKMELELAPTSIAALIDGCVMLVRERATAHGIRIESRIDPEIRAISADARKLKQVILNVLSNAVKYTPDGGRVEVIADRRGDDVVIAVRDTGAGIAPEDQERIFEEFQQTRVGRQTEGSTGLGLSLARRLIELHGGTIGVESAVGVGSTFTVRLPAASAD
jgi:signal transduction histidine kinase